MSVSGRSTLNTDLSFPVSQDTPSGPNSLYEEFLHVRSRLENALAGYCCPDQHFETEIRRVGLYNKRYHIFEGFFWLMGKIPQEKRYIFCSLIVKYWSEFILL